MTGTHKPLLTPPQSPLGMALAVAMAREGHSNSSLAGQAGLSVQTIGRVLTIRDYEPTDTNLSKLMRYLNQRGWGLLLVTEPFEHASRHGDIAGIDPRTLREDLTGYGSSIQPPYTFGDEPTSPPIYALPPQREVRRFFELLSIARNEVDTTPSQRTELLRSDYEAVNVAAQAIVDLFVYRVELSEWTRQQFQPGGFWYERSTHQTEPGDTPELTPTVEN